MYTNQKPFHPTSFLPFSLAAPHVPTAYIAIVFVSHSIPTSYSCAVPIVSYHQRPATVCICTEIILSKFSCVVLWDAPHFPILKSLTHSPHTTYPRTFITLHAAVLYDDMIPERCCKSCRPFYTPPISLYRHTTIYGHYNSYWYLYRCNRRKYIVSKYLSI